MREINDSNGIFLSQIGTHNQNNLSVAEIRDEIILHHLFTQRIMISDSTVNNTPKLRALIYRENIKEDFGCQCDLLTLIKQGSIVPVVRDNFSGFNNLRLSQSKNPTPDLPPQKFCELLDENCMEVLQYSLSDVSRLFKQNLLNMLKRSSQFGKKAIGVLTEYIHSVETPYYAVIRNMIENCIDKRYMTVLQGSELDKLVYICFGYNVPQSLDLTCCDSVKNLVASSQKSDIANEVMEEETVAADSFYIFHPEIIRVIPSDVIQNIITLPTFRPVSKRAQFGVDNSSDLQIFCDELGSYLNDLEEVIKQAVSVNLINSVHKKNDSKITIKWSLTKFQSITSICGFRADGTPSEQIINTHIFSNVHKIPNYTKELDALYFQPQCEVDV